MPLFGTPGERIAYRVYPAAPEGGPPLVLLHGFTASAASWAANIDDLRRHFEVITVELLGHGESDAPEDAAPYAPGPTVERLLALFTELGHERVLLCGHSLGGAVGLRLALDAPERLTGLVVMNSNSAAGTPEWRDQARAGMAAMAAGVRKEGTAYLRKTRLYPAHSKRLDPRSRDLLIHDFDRLTPDAVANTATALTVDVNCFERLGELRVPALVILGDRDADFVKNAPAFVGRLPEAYVYTAKIEGAGHAANLEQPEAFERTILTFATEIGLLERPVTEPTRGRGFASRGLTAAGAVLVLGGLALLGAAFLTGRGGSSSPAVLAAAAATSTPAKAVVTEVAGNRSAGPTAAATQALTAASPSPGATVAAATATKPAPTRASAPTETPTATPTQAPSPTPSPTPVQPTATPSGPGAAIAGASSGAAGDTLTFTDASRPGSDVQARVWGVSGPGKEVPQQNAAAFIVRFPSVGCYTVSLTVSIRGQNRTFSASKAVAIGGVSCQ